MAKNINYSCDACGTVLWGRKGTAYIKKSSLQINGQIVQQAVDPNTEYEEVIFLTRTPNERLSFCDINCLGDYIETEKQLYMNRKQTRLREQASAESIERGAYGYNKRR